MTTYHDAKNELDRQIDEDDLSLTGPSAALFRYLLSHTFYKGDSYGWVRDDRSSVDTLAKQTGYGIRTVKDHLQSLQCIGMIKRYKRPKATGGRWPDRIFISWEYLHKESADGYDSEGAAPALMESPAPSESAAPAPSCGAAPAPSYIPQEKVKNYDEERGQARAIAAAEPTSTGEGAARAEEIPTWDGDVTRLVLPDRALGGARDYYVSAAGHIRPILGQPRTGEVRAALDVLALKVFRADTVPA